MGHGAMKGTTAEMVMVAGCGDGGTNSVGGGCGGDVEMTRVVVGKGRS